MLLLQWIKKHLILTASICPIIGISIAGYIALTHQQSTLLLIVCMALTFVPLLFLGMRIRNDLRSFNIISSQQSTRAMAEEGLTPEQIIESRKKPSPGSSV
jgi:hypothetical protein